MQALEDTVKAKKVGASHQVEIVAWVLNCVAGQMLAAKKASGPSYPPAISRVALIGSFNVLHSAVRFASRGRTRSFSQK
jgi:hypothetical protein